MFDESDEEMTDLLATAPACPTPAAGQFPMTEDAWVGSSELVDSGVQGASLVESCGYASQSDGEGDRAIEGVPPPLRCYPKRKPRQQCLVLWLKLSSSPCLGMGLQGILTLWCQEIVSVLNIPDITLILRRYCVYDT